MEQLIVMIALAGVVLALAAGVGVAVLARKLRTTNNRYQLLVADMDNRMNEMRHHLEAVAQHTRAQLQRLSQPVPPPVAAPTPEPVATATSAATTAASSTRQSVTERRHRVLTLARRGMDIKAIAQTLGMPHGEVALIIRMSNPKFGD
ncbi:MAG: hypothetical protein U0Y68_05790 [Blastocatellia bacterium]